MQLVLEELCGGIVWSCGVIKLCGAAELLNSGVHSKRHKILVY